MMATIVITSEMFEDRATGLLTKAAGVALMPYMNEEERADASLHTYLVDGEVAIPSKGVERDDEAIAFDGGTPTGRVYVSTISDYKRLLGIEES